MSLSREGPIRVITDRLSWLTVLCSLRGRQHLFDAHTLAQGFYRRLLNEVYGLQLTVLDSIRSNFPAIDLGDTANKRAFQVTSDPSPSKIQSTLATFARHGLATKFGKVQFAIIGEKARSYAKVKVPAGIEFTPEEDVIDHHDLIRTIQALELAKQEDIARIVDEEIHIDRFPKAPFLHVSVYNDPPGYWPGIDDARMMYVAENRDGEITIQPSLPYLDILAAGGPIEPLRYITPTYGPFDWAMPTLDLKLLNRTDTTCYFAEACLEIEQSSLDPTPVVVVVEDTYRTNAGAFQIANEGPTPLENVVVRFDLLPGLKPTPNEFPETYPFECEIGFLEDRADIQAEEAFAARGFDLERWDALCHAELGTDGYFVETNGLADAPMSNDEYEAAIASAMGPFRDGVGTVLGEINFSDPRDSCNQTVLFRAVVFVSNENRRGLPRPPTATYHVRLETAGANYVRELAGFSHELKPGESDRVLVRLDVQQPSIHRLRVVLRNIDGAAIISRWIRLACFVPRTRIENRA